MKIKEFHPWTESETKLEPISSRYCQIEYQIDHKLNSPRDRQIFSIFIYSSTNSIYRSISMLICHLRPKAGVAALVAGDQCQQPLLHHHALNHGGKKLKQNRAKSRIGPGTTSFRPPRRLTTFDSNGGLITKHAPHRPCPLFISISACAQAQRSKNTRRGGARVHRKRWISSGKGNRGASFHPTRCNFPPALKSVISLSFRQRVRIGWCFESHFFASRSRFRNWY